MNKIFSRIYAQPLYLVVVEIILLIILWAVEQCIEKYRKNNMDLVAPAIYYKKKTIAKFNIWANESGLHSEVPKQYRMNPFFAKIKYFLYMSKEEKTDVLLSPLARLKRKLIINKKSITD